MVELIANNTVLQYDKYIKQGDLMVLREGLSATDPNYIYNYLKNSEVFIKNNITPEMFGIKNPLEIEFKDKSRDELINEILNLRNIINYSG